jgi:Putative porin
LANAFSQADVIRGGMGRLKQFGNIRTGGSTGTDSIRRRDKNEDSITIRFRYLDSTRNYLLDSSINDFTRRFPIPATNIFLGNTGSPSRSILFSPFLRPGWDPGFHVLDVYKWTMDKVRFFNTTRPYSELNYQLASKSEQVIEILHTQNVKPNWNFSFQYRMINAPGFFQNQKINHNNYLFNSWFQTVNKRYNNYLVLLGNKLQAGENGGIDDAEDYLNDPDYKDRYIIPVKLGGDKQATRNFFNTDVGTGNRYNEFTVLLRQQYDFGKKDSLVTDSTVVPLFYPRLRFEHSFQFAKYKYEYSDYVGKAAYYKANYDTTLSDPVDTVYFKDQWKELLNDFSIYQFPDAKNLQQFIKIGAAIQNLSQSSPAKHNYYNVFGHAEYRNKTRNQKWDLEANGKLYFTGLNAGDYSVYANIQRAIGKKTPGYVQLGFENVNREPSFIFNANSSFYLPQPSPKNFKKENTTHLFASLFQPSLRLKLSGHYYLLTNYSYLTSYYQLQQNSSLFNVLLVSAEKTIKLGKRWYWHADVYFQQKVGNADVNLPQLFTRNRIGYEGNLGFKSLNIAFGLEARYHTPYKADGYSPALGHFFSQDSIRINNLPDIAAYLHFRIRSFKAYVRLENLNAAKAGNGGLNFTNNNFAAPGYPYPGMLMRVGIYWNFIN